MDRFTPVFAIAAAAELAGMHPQTLRQYDRIGLVSPQRTRGNTRRYSLHDVTQLREVARLSAEGLSLEGIRRVLQLEDKVQALEERVHQLERALAEERLMRPERRVFAAGSAGEVVTLRRGTRVRRNAEVVVWKP
ncbi:MerR family transcriptional regulator [Leucobacter viscericola]|uniref:MerR family transcriptional regulator n=1 Tax=Leucobacter viscericola TaxID=2714935 RepID=A0A6G7XJU8_9MICO|nr:MerR family transcriptional regulator [Leucobacter viscericola]